MRKKICSVLAGCAFCSMLAMTNALAASAGATLYSNQYSSSTGFLGNTTGTFRIVGSIATGSKHNVEFDLVYGNSSSSLTNRVVVTVLEPGDPSFDKTRNVNKDFYTVAQMTMYGNSYTTPMKECVASTIFENK